MPQTPENRNRRWGLIGTIGFHLILLLLLLFLGLRAPYPPPAEEGVTVIFGTNEAGSGDIVPTTPKPVSEETQPEHVPPEAEPTEEEVMTQDMEEAPAVDPQPEETEPVEPTETKEQREEPEDTEPTVDPDALYKGKKEDKARPSEGHGHTDQPGYEGDPEGGRDGGRGDKDYGSGSTGIGYALSGRSMVKVPQVSDRSQETGKVVIRIKVDRHGNVQSSSYTQRGSTSNDAYLVNLAKKAAREAKFNPDRNAPEEQFGTITFVFQVR